MIIAPSVLSMDYSKMKEQLNEVAQSQAKWLHVDIMDGHFVPNLSFGPDITKQIKVNTELFMDVHIMVENPHYFSDVFMEAGADLLTFHVEACNSSEAVLALIHKIRERGVKVGLSIKPSTPVDYIMTFLPMLDLVLIMSVEPGFGGQSFIYSALDKIKALRDRIDELNLNCLIEVDGGVNEETAKLCLEAGADVLVAGSYIFKHNIKEQVQRLWDLKPV